ncbi:hypothetical protein ACFOPX_06335, partial [Helicobacter baculiformis]
RPDSVLSQKEEMLTGGKGIDTDIETPLNESSTSPLKITPNPAFGEHFKEFELKGAQAVAKLLEEQRGQVAGAFYREDLGAITLAWGEAGSAKSDGWGLSKIAKYHPEVLDKLDTLIQTLPIVKETPNRYQLENANYKASIRKDFEGVPQNWVLTAFEKKESIARRSTDLPSTQEGAKKTPLAHTQGDITTPPLKVKRAHGGMKCMQNLKRLLKLSVKPLNLSICRE